ncbi:MAG: glycosyltransferase family 9 protein [Desulfobacca sp.]|uniref:glycosyltransferase family 9 protein n=1 Tax=Desulfobacca sp. TaxID=2067990 RepID=UPI004049A36D
MWRKLRLQLATSWLRWRQRRQPGRSWNEWRPEAVQRVLLLNATALGDFLFSTPAIQGLVERFPTWQVDILVQPGLLPLIAVTPGLHQGWACPKGSLRLWRLARELRAQQYDLVIILHGNDPEATLLAVLTGAPYIIGSAHSALSFVYAAAVPRQGLSEHAIERRLNLVRPLGVEVAAKQMAISLPNAVRQRAAALLREHFGSQPPLLLALHPGGSDAYKRWPAARFAELARWLTAVYGARLLIIGSADERLLGEQIAAQAEAPALVTGGRFDLLTVAGLLSHCQLLVGNDSGPLHLGLALQVPSIGLLGADAPERVGPYQAPWGQAIYQAAACPRNPCLTKRCPRSLCLEAIQTAEVYHLIRQWWAPNFLTDRNSIHV